jgi:hypothetical protein
MIQIALVLPIVARMAYTIRNYIIGFLHLIMLGILSFFLLGLYDQVKGLNTNKLHANGLRVLGLGIVLSELILFLQGTLLWLEWGFLPKYHLLLFLCSTLMPIGILFLLIAEIRRSKTE